MVPLSLLMEGSKTSEATKQPKKGSFYTQLGRCPCGRNEEDFLEYGLESGKR